VPAVPLAEIILPSVRESDSPQARKSVKLGRWKNLSCGLEAVGRPGVRGIGNSVSHQLDQERGCQCCMSADPNWLKIGS
jgi:hypothetical protein